MRADFLVTTESAIEAELMNQPMMMTHKRAMTSYLTSFWMQSNLHSKPIINEFFTWFEQS